ncbi:PREDICTED: acyl-CoA synthetase family member 4-like [Thamnophis sirtalis]|uniref:Acyl-CoA synthetase family member 4-like n=1 Tax=Thamnophis sirtalis TaxID=35019 RepID=A0A6I9YAE5_9SAUR|nr:PREDICTED: acyl-CoA synthetase family member 4-like [Thamnophis sirtalis]
MTLHEMVQTAARLYPERRAVCFDACNSQIPVYYKYKTVMRLATELTDFLRKHCNLTENLEIGLYCYPGINLPSWILGLLQVPAAYSPIDPDALSSLYTSFMKTCGFQYVLVEEDKVDKFTTTYGHLYSQNSLQRQRIGLILFQRQSGVPLTKYGNAESESSVVERVRQEQQRDVRPPKDLLNVREKHSLAYILHTSGTTGLPKIVRVPHKCIVPNILHLRLLQVPAAYSPIDPDALSSLYTSFMKTCGFQYVLVEEDKVDSLFYISLPSACSPILFSDLMLLYHWEHHYLEQQLKSKMLKASLSKKVKAKYL